MAEQYSVAKSLERLHQSKTFRWRSGATKVRIGHEAEVARDRSVFGPFTIYEWLLSFQKQPFFIELATGRFGRSAEAG
jgi:hypothetical protein